MANGAPTVSVLVPTYNGAEYLQQAFDSIEAQTYRNLEVVVSDDGSVDNTWQIAENFRDNSCIPVTLLRHQQDSLAGNWNHCVEHASGKYIKFLFQDDLLAAECIEKMVSVAESNPQIGLVFSPRAVVASGDVDSNATCQNIIENYSMLHHGWSQLREIQPGSELLADPNLFSHPSNKIGEPSIVLLRSSTLMQVGGFDPELKQLVDLEMWWRIMSVSDVAFIDEKLSTFRVHQEQASVVNSDSGEAGRDAIRFADKVLSSDYRQLLPRSTIDQLTSLRNRNHWTNLLKRGVSRISRELKSRIWGGSST